MFDPQRLLGKLAGDVLSRELGGLGGAASGGAGLMTVLGIGVAAYEHFTSQKRAQQTGASAPPPPPPGQSGQVPPPPPGAAAPSAPPPPVQTLPSGDVALRCIQAMIAAAHADGVLDASELKAIMERLEQVDLTDEERQWLIKELHSPKSIAEIAAGISDPEAARAIYVAAQTAVVVDTDEEKRWLEELAAALGLAEQQAAPPPPPPPPGGGPGH